MQSPRNAAIAAIIGLAVIVVLFLVLSGEEESNTPTTTTQATTTTTTDTGDDGNTGDGQGNGGKADEKPPEKEPAEEGTVIEIKNGEPVDGVAEIEVSKGDAIQFTVESDTAYEIHMHGYDVSKDVPAGGSVEFDVPADIDGVFEVEIEDTVTPIAEVTVNP
jgi:hypothetical protein